MCITQEEEKAARDGASLPLGTFLVQPGGQDRTQAHPDLPAKHMVTLPTDRCGSEPDPMTARAEIFPPLRGKWGEQDRKDTGRVLFEGRVRYKHKNNTEQCFLNFPAYTSHLGKPSNMQILIQQG